MKLKANYACKTDKIRYNTYCSLELKSQRQPTVHVKQTIYATMHVKLISTHACRTNHICNKPGTLIALDKHDRFQVQILYKGGGRSKKRQLTFGLELFVGFHRASNECSRQGR